MKGINERGSLGNLLFYMQQSTNITEKYGRGIIIGSYLQNSSWNSVENFMQNLADTKKDFKPFNYVQAEMSPITGRYSLYYLNNNDTNSYSKLNTDDENMFVFALSNSNANDPFNKVKNGKEKFNQIINDYSQHLDKQRMVDEIINNILQDEAPNFPDERLASYMNEKDEQVIKGVSQINADYTTYWRNSHSRTSTLILVDYDDNVEYYEYNLTEWQSLSPRKIASKRWEMNSFKFKLNPLYLKNDSRSMHLSNFVFLTYFVGIFTCYILYKIY